MYLKGYLCVMTAGILWGILGPFSKLAFSEGLQPMEVAFWRAVIAWIFFGGHAVITKNVRVNKKDIPPLFLFGICGVTFFYGSYQMAIINGGAALSSVLLYTAPAWVAIMSYLFFKESITIIKLLALFMTIAGVAGISIGTGSGMLSDFKINTLALIYGLLAGFFYSLYYIFGKYFSKRNYTSPNLFLYMLPIGALGLLPWVTFTHKTPLAWAALLCIAFLSTYAAYYFYYLGLKNLEASRASIVATIEPVVAAMVAFFWWDEYFTITGYIGSVLILIAVLVMILNNK